MGAACCVAAKDKTISSGPHTGPLQRQSRHSPTWSFRWDNRVREAEEETASGNTLSNPSSGNDRMTSKSSDNTTAATYGSERDSPLLDSSHKSTASEQTAGIQRIPSRGEASPQKITDLKESIGSSSISCSSPLKLSPAVSSLSTSSLSSQSQLILPPNSDPRFHHPHRSPPHMLIFQSSDYNNNNNQIPDHKSPRRTYSISEETSLYIPPPSSGNESTRSFDTGSIPGFSDLTNSRRGERWSFDSEASGLSRDKISVRSSESLSFDLHSCGICTKQLNERPPFGLSKLISISGLSVVSVLTCGHVYHAECLEYMTPEINKYDPSCPVCAFGEKKMAMMSELALKGKLESKARKKKSRNSVVDSDHSGDVWSDYNMSSGGGLEGKGSKPFLRRHFSFGSKSGSSSNKPSSDNHQSSGKKGFFWARSSKY